MIANYGICAQCSELIENTSVMWRDIDGHSFSLTAKDDGFVYHVHTPTNADSYYSNKYGYDIRTEILSVMGDFGYSTDILGDVETFGFYEFFEDFSAIVAYDSRGFVSSTIYDSPEMARNVWSQLETDYSEFTEDEDDEPLYDEYGDGEYAYGSGAYNSDLWD